MSEVTLTMRTAAVSLLLVAMLGFGCAHKATSYQPLSGNAGVSLPNLAGSETGSFELVDHGLIPMVLIPSLALADRYRFLLSWADPLWNPTKDQAVAALARVPSLLVTNRPEAVAVVSKSNGRYLSRLRDGFTNEVCQVVGVTVDREKGIWLNFLPNNDSFSENWRTRFVQVYDGGPRYWSVIYLPARDEFTNLQIDKGF